MARRHHALESSLLLTALGLVLGAVAAGLLPLLAMGLGSGVSGLRSYAWHVVGFTLWQAFLSTLISLAIALPLARALAARRFPGREVFLRLMLLPQALPAIVVVLGLLGLFGEAGWLGGIISPYGLTGILLAHVFFNMPLATRVLLTRMEAIPPESYRLAAQLRFTGWDVFRHVEWPALAAALKGIGGLIFLLCTASFTVVLVLGGGPQATTLEVAIYQALRMDFDPGFAALLSLAQLLLCAIAVFAAGRFAQAPDVFSQTLGNPPIARTSLPALFFDIAILAIGAANPAAPARQYLDCRCWSHRAHANTSLGNAHQHRTRQRCRPAQPRIGLDSGPCRSQTARACIPRCICSCLARFAHHAAGGDGNRLVRHPRAPCRCRQACAAAHHPAQCADGHALCPHRAGALHC